MRKIIPIVLLFFTALFISVTPAATVAEDLIVLHVSPEGNDSWSGTSHEYLKNDGPLATLQEARNRIRKMKADGFFPKGGVEVRVQEGTYYLDNPLELKTEDSGTDESPVIYRAAPGSKVRLTGGITLIQFKPVANPAVLSKLKPEVHGQVYQSDLRLQGIHDFGEVDATGKRIELFFNDLPMTISRWPDEGYTFIKDVPRQDEKDGTGGQF